MPKAPKVPKAQRGTPGSAGVLLEKEKGVPEDVVDTHLDDITGQDPEKELRSNDKEGGGNEFGSRSTFFRPGVETWKKYSRPKPYAARTVQNVKVVLTRNGVFAPTLFGSSTVHSRTPQLVRKAGATGAPIPLDGLRLSMSQLSLPVTRV